MSLKAKRKVSKTLAAKV